MNLYKKAGIIAGLILLLTYFAYSIIKKEDTLKNGKLVLLQLAPKDPRSLMQGDYMVLQYAVTNDLQRGQWLNDVPVDESTVSITDSSVVMPDSKNNPERKDESRPRNLNKKLRNEGYMILQLDNNNVGHLMDIDSTLMHPGAGTIAVKYKHYSYDVTIGAESYFFEEGKAQKFDEAKYGGLRVDEKGNSILVGLYDEKFRLIEP